MGQRLAPDPLGVAGETSARVTSPEGQSTALWPPSQNCTAHKSSSKDFHGTVSSPAHSVHRETLDAQVETLRVHKSWEHVKVPTVHTAVVLAEGLVEDAGSPSTGGQTAGVEFRSGWGPCVPLRT